MKGHIFYNTETGFIRKFLVQNRTDERQVPGNLDAGFRAKWYEGETFSANESKIDVTDVALPVIAKTEQSITVSASTIDADGVEKTSLTGIEEGSKAYIEYDNGSHKLLSVDGTTLRFCTDIVGDHDITLINGAWLNTTVTITATAP